MSEPGWVGGGPGNQDPGRPNKHVSVVIAHAREARLGMLLAVPGAILVGAAIGAGYARYALPMAVAVAGATFLPMLRGMSSRRPVALQRGSFASAAAICAFAVLPLNGMRIVPSVTYGDALIVATAVLLLIGFVVGAHPLAGRWPPAWIGWGVLLLLISYFLYELFPVPTPANAEIFTNRNPLTREITYESNLRLVIQVAFALGIAPLILGSALNTWRRVQLAAKAWMIGTALSALVAILAAFTSYDVQEAFTGAAYSIQAYRGDAGRYAGLTVHSSALGLTCAMALPLALMHLGAAQARRAWGAAALSGIYLVAILISGARAGLFAALVVLVYMAVRHPPIRSRLAAMSVVALGVAMTQASLIENLSVLQRLTGTVASSEFSNVAHSSRVLEALDLWLRRPVTGYGFQVIRGAHNVILQFLTAGGVIACAGFVAIAGGNAALGSRLRRFGPPHMRPLAAALLASMAAWLTASLVTSSVFDRFLYVPGALLLGMLFAYRAGDVQQETI